MFRRIMRLTNHSNPYDAVLAISNAKRLGTSPRAGRVGLPPNPNPKAVNVNCGDYFSKLDPKKSPRYGDWTHAWHIGNRVFARDLAMALEGAIDRNAIPTRRNDNGNLTLIDAPRPATMANWDIKTSRQRANRISAARHPASKPAGVSASLARHGYPDDCHRPSIGAAAATPMMAQYIEIKAANPDCLLFYRMGDFYEMFFDDAEIASRALGIALTKRGKHLGADIPMCGVPIHAADQYLQKLIALGHRVAVCEQIEDPAEARKRGGKAVVRRDVIRLVTPGTLTEDALLDAGRNNFLAAVARLARRRRGADLFAHRLDRHLDRRVPRRDERRRRALPPTSPGSSRAR